MFISHYNHYITDPLTSQEGESPQMNGSAYQLVQSTMLVGGALLMI